MEEQYWCLISDMNITQALSREKISLLSVSLLCFAVGMFSLLDHANIINMNVSVTMVKGRIS